jgi:hypothetical protein
MPDNAKDSSFGGCAGILFAAMIPHKPDASPVHLKADGKVPEAFFVDVFRDAYVVGPCSALAGNRKTP